MPTEFAAFTASTQASADSAATRLRDRTRPACVLAALLFASPVLAQVVLGPVPSPDGRSRYYVVQAPNWNAARARALAMGGDLATIDHAAENDFVLANLTDAGRYKLFIGLNDADTEGTFAWSSGSASTYRNWRPGQPGGGTLSNYAVMQPGDAGRWDAVSATYTPYALVEINGPIRVPGEAATIQQAVDLMIPVNCPDIELAPGVHLAPGGTSWNGLGGKLTGAGAGQTIVRHAGGTTNSVVGITGNWDIRGITFENDAGMAYFLYLDSGQLSLRDCELAGQGSGFGLELGAHCTVNLERCRLSGFTTSVSVNGGQVNMLNCLVRASGRALRLIGGKASLVNCVVMGDMNREFTAGSITLRNSIARGAIAGSGPVSVEHTNIVPFVAGTGNISSDPLFVSETDFRLRPGSPCIDAGSLLEYFHATGQASSTTDLGGNTRLLDDTATPDTGAGAPAIDMGCFEFQPGPACRGDFNGDTIVDFFDYLDFVAAFDAGC